ncbi:MAG: DUF5718 family protein [Myxococcales bacterium]|nr:DUF5718 family protein [Myxococcales bacterium]
MQGFEDAIGLGVAGNFTGHLEQAGEAADFVDVAVADAAAPKGVFPFYVPGSGDHFLATYPLSADTILLPSRDATLQLEPELGVVCELQYQGDRVAAVVPRAFGAYNDCSIRREGAGKISEKKNWGPASKGISGQLIDIDRFEAGGVLDRYRIACYLVREGQVHSYGVDSPVSGYSYFYSQLLEWLLARLGEQRDEGPLEDIGRWLEVAGRPRRAVISVGATRYTDFGEHNFLEPGDEAHVLVYDAERHELSALEGALMAGIEPAEGLSLLRQRVVLQGSE